MQPACTASLSSAGLDPDQDCLWPHLICHLAPSSSTRRDECNQPTEGALLWAGAGPTYILTDNDTVFRTSQFKTFLGEWRVRLRFRCANVPSGNSIIERCHRTVKRIATRKRCYYTRSSILVQHNTKDWHRMPRHGERCVTHSGTKPAGQSVLTCLQKMQVKDL